MRTEFGKNSLRIVGKAWEIKSQLKQMSKSPIKLKTLLNNLDKRKR